MGESIEQAEDRKFFSALHDKIGLKQAEAGTAIWKCPFGLRAYQQDAAAFPW